MASWEQRCVDADTAARLVKNDHWVFLPGNCGEPRRFVEALARRAQSLNNVRVVQLLTTSKDLIGTDIAGHIRIASPFIGGAIRKAVNENSADFIPCHLSQVPRFFKEGILPIDVAIVHVSPPGRTGFCSLGVEGGIDIAPATCAPIVIAEMNDQMPHILGSCCMHVSSFNNIIRVSYPLLEFHTPEPAATESEVARNVANLIDDGTTIQMGIGEIPSAVCSFISDRRDLGIHSEIITDPMANLALSGAVTGRKKAKNRRKIVSGIALGSKQLFQFLHKNPNVEFMPQEYVNCPFVISRLGVTSINSALAVDLTGQVCADSIGSSIYSGAGGQVDFVRGAGESRRGKTIIALTSTYQKGGETRSRVVAQLLPGSGVTTTRYDVHFVVTEYGMVDLFGKTLSNRVRSLMSIAHPDFQEELAQAAFKLWKISV